MPFSRRDFLQATAAALALPAFLPLRQESKIEWNSLSLAPFVDRLPLPVPARPVGRRPDPDHPGRTLPFYRIEAREVRLRLHRDLPPARLWGYDGQFPGPTFETRSGEGVLVEWANALPARHFLPVDHTLDGAGPHIPEVRTVAHLHGGRTPAHSDGYPDHWQIPGQSALYHYPNRQDAAMLWYHDHAMGINRLNIYAGLFGAWFVRDAAEDAWQWPSGEYELPLILCDRLLYQDGQLHYPVSPDPRHPWVPEVYGDAMLVNGKVKPYCSVEPRLYRLRILNGSNGRFYVLSFSNRQEFHLIGLDQGLRSAPLRMHEIALAPGERIDVLVDFAACAGQSPVLRSEAFDLMQFRVASRPNGQLGPPPRLPAALRPVPRLDPAAASVTRQLSLNDYMDGQENSSLMLLNATYWKAPVTETPVLGATEIWSFVNLSEDSHPIHLHLVRFQILDRCAFDDFEFTHTGKLRLTGVPIPAAPQEQGWKDTVRADAGMVTRIIVKFEGYPGRYVWHCHILEHEDNAMMRPYEVLAPATA